MAIIAPTCFYYQSALFRALSKNPRIDLTVYFCSDEGLHSRDLQRMYHSDKYGGMGTAILQGYKYRWLRSFSPRPTYLKSLYGLINLGVWGEIRRTRPDVVVLMSWMNPTWWIAILACLVSKIPLLYLTDANVTAEATKGTFKTWAKKLFLGRWLFRWTAGFLCAGTANRLLYKHYGVPDHKLVPFAYSWGYDEYLRVSTELSPRKLELRDELGIPRDKFVFLFCGRLSKEKGTDLLLQAYHQLLSPDKLLVFVEAMGSSNHACKS